MYRLTKHQTWYNIKWLESVKQTELCNPFSQTKNVHRRRLFKLQVPRIAIQPGSQLPILSTLEFEFSAGSENKEFWMQES